MNRKKVLFICNHRIGRSPGQRFRFEQYLDYLEEHGFECTLSNIISEKDDGILYSKGNYFKKALIAKKAWAKRKEDALHANEYDIIFIFREALLTGSTRFERLFQQAKAKVLVDFDDAIWLPNVSAGNRSLRRLKKPGKTRKIIACADMVFAGNDYLASFAEDYCSNVKVIPTTIDTTHHLRKEQKKDNRICIGWTGTQTTIKYLDLLSEVFLRLKKKFGDQLYFKVISDASWSLNGVEVLNENWNKEQEIQQLEEIDIGVMPLSDDQWSRGKCGFKGLQYMAMESAAVLSPVGVNNSIIEHGVNGFLANSEEDWFSILSTLIEDIELRRKVGAKGRETVQKHYSVDAFKDKYVYYFNELING